MTGRRNHARTDDEALAEYRMHERIERGEKVAGPEAERPAASAGRRRDALTRHSHARQR